MAILLGVDGSAFGGTVNEGQQASSGDSIWHEPETGEGYIPLASGTPDTAWINISSWGDTESIKIVLYELTTRTKLATSGVISAGATGPRSAAISTSALVSGVGQYALVAVPNDGYFDTVNDSTTSFRTSSVALNYTTPDTPLPTASVGNREQFAIWLTNSDSVVMPVDSGSIVAEGQVSTFAVTIPVTSADIVAEGFDVALLFDQAYVVPVTVGEIVAEGQEIPFILTQPGIEASIVAQGQSVTLLFSDGVTAGEIVAEGQDVSLVFAGNTSITVESGSIVATGGSVILTPTGIASTEENFVKAFVRPFVKLMAFTPVNIGRV